MNRYKFRAWDKEKEQMVYHIEETYDGLAWYKENDNNEEEYNYMSSFNDWFDEQFAIMQYTGLKDESDDEIYESDIVKYTYDELPMGHYREVEVIGVITWGALGYGLRIISSYKPVIIFNELEFDIEDYHFEENEYYPLHEMQFLPEDLKVIGNIYQLKRSDKNE